MIYKVLMILAGLFGVFTLKKVKDSFSKWITIIFFLSIVVTIQPHDFAKWGFLLFLIATAVVVVKYVLYPSGMPIGNRLKVILISFPVFLLHLFISNNWPFSGLLSWVMVIPIVVFLIIGFRDKKEFANEIGFLAIIAMSAAIIFWIQIKWMIDAS